MTTSLTSINDKITDNNHHNMVIYTQYITPGVANVEKYCASGYMAFYIFNEV